MSRKSKFKTGSCTENSRKRVMSDFAVNNSFIRTIVALIRNWKSDFNVTCRSFRSFMLRSRVCSETIVEKDGITFEELMFLSAQETLRVSSNWRRIDHERSMLPPKITFTCLLRLLVAFGRCGIDGGISWKRKRFNTLRLKS